jgi:hypothetical protein
MFINITHSQNQKSEVNNFLKVRFPVFIRERDPRDVDPKVIAAGEAYRAN